MNMDVLPLLAIIVVDSIKFDGITAPGKKPSLPVYIEACGKKFSFFFHSINVPNPCYAYDRLGNRSKTISLERGVLMWILLRVHLMDQKRAL